MRIALFTETFIPKVDGIVTTLCQTVRQLRQRGHEVLIVAPDGGVADFDGVRIIGLPGVSFPFYPELTLALPHASIRKHLLEFKPDLVHVADPALLGIAGLYYSGGPQGGMLGLPLVISYHTDLPHYLHHFGLGFIEPLIWPLLRVRHGRATVTLCTSHKVLDELNEHGIKRTALWPGGVDATMHRPERRSAAMRARLSSGRTGALLFYAGRLSPEKEIERLKPILEAVLAADPQASLALAGDGPHRQRLERYFAGLPVVFMGFLHGVDLAEAYASSDVFVMPSRSETLGLVVLEAMSAGLPVLGARAGGIPEMIEDGVNGRLFDEEGEAARIVEELLANPEEARRLGHAARASALAHGWGVATDALLEFYEVALVEMAKARANRSAKPIGSRPGRMLSSATRVVIRRLLP